ncbi:sensor domain-containing diguanylate cyclase [Andreprevotia chitinilytica]|uniref:sensor domain-containing diguanylate cyclase n=1 Tax=Andreprevotia chitinilytica TaxID=396808 RepID=UPI00055128B4|nr:diguanylate cyclase [Andreprevotia chitinilytica]
MLTPRHPENEAQRIALLHQLTILDTPPEPVFDRITRVAARVLGVPTAVISLVDENRQWFKSRYGLDTTETPRDISFCGHAILGEDTLVVADAQADERFHDNPLVTGAPHIRFYAGHPLASKEGLKLGTLCVIDNQPRQLDEAGRQALVDLASFVERELQSRELLQLTRQTHAADERALEEQEAIFRETFEQAPVGIAHVDIAGHWLAANSCLLKMLGYRRDELFRLTLKDLVNPEDHLRLRGQINRLMSGSITDCQHEMRLQTKDKDGVWTKLTMALHRNQRGEPQHFIVITENIEQRKAADAAIETMQQGLEARVAERTAELAAARQELLTITDHLPVLIAHIDSQQRYRFVNALYGEWFGIDHTELIGQPARVMLDEAARTALAPYIDKVMQGLTVKFNTRQRFGDSIRDARFTIVPEEDEHHQVRGYYQMVQDISQVTQLMEQLRGQAFADALTGLPNRRALVEYLKEAFARQKRSRNTLALLFLDLDGFKGVNDTLGHDAGDELLRLFAERLKDNVRETDIVARLAGDEFTILLENLQAAESDATQVAAKIVAAMKTPFVLDGHPTTVSTSIGIALRPVDYREDGDALLNRADEAMYHAKHAGKSRYHLG